MSVRINQACCLLDEKGQADLIVYQDDDIGIQVSDLPADIRLQTQRSPPAQTMRAPRARAPGYDRRFHDLRGTHSTILLDSSAANIIGTLTTGLGFVLNSFQAN
jgi:hypothetical protein